MAISDFTGYSSVLQGNAYWQKPVSITRPAVTLDAEPDPKTPHRYAVNTKPQVIPTPEKPSELKNLLKRPNQNTDPVSRAFLAVADYAPIYHRIDIRV
ncbi:MAG: hypothetical protein EOO52_04685 [Gammaproteobacteria bacterium]|nr:MAG: hypothetical protein EOO52_04685 [Gammaproteobacteria bacterium]